MNKNSEQLNKLRSLLEGKTILKIEPPGTDEGICIFHLKDGSAYRLSATDLGFWIEEACGKKGFKSLNSLIIAYEYHAYGLEPEYNYDLPDAGIIIKNNQVIIIAPDEKIFKININLLSKEEKMLIDDSSGRFCLKKAIHMGPLWRIYFKDNPDLPKKFININLIKN